MNDKEKILKYLEYKGISKSAFYKKTGLSSGFLDKGASLGVDKLRVITDNYQDLNLKWFFDDEEPMITPLSDNHNMVSEPSAHYGGSANPLMELLIEKDKELKKSYEEIGRLKEVVRRFSTQNKGIKDATV